MKIKVGSLFDGIGGTPLSAVLSGAEPVWASEIEKVPISITKRHFPNMKHYGDITQINGAEIEPVDIIVGGSPCQDLSVAGKRAGLEGERSGLFMDQMRIVKEMRNATRKQAGNGSDELPRPRYMVWENVPGAFSSNKGEDFRAVLEEVCKVADPEASIPEPAKNKWLSSGTILGDGYSVAWRVVDAQYWGVPQRRRRIYLVADFGGHTAPEICFESESVSGDITESGEAGEGIAEDAEGSSGSSGECKCVTAYSLQGNMIGRADHNGPQGSGVNEDVSFTLNTVDRHAVCYNGDSITSPTNRQNPKPGDPCHTLGTDSRNYVCYKEPQAVCYGFASRQQAMSVTEDCPNPILSTDYKDPQVVCYGIDTYNQSALIETASTLRSASGGDSKAVVCYGIGSHHSGGMKSANPHSGFYEADTSRTIDQNGGNPACNQGGIAVVQPEPTVCRMVAFGEYATDGTCSTMKQRDYKDATDLVVEPVEKNAEQKYIVRRLTAKECCRLQGYPEIFELDESMTKNEYIAFNIAQGNIVVDALNGKVYRTRGPGGVALQVPIEMPGSNCNGYLVVAIRNGKYKASCRVHRIVWISENGIIPDGYCVDHINNDKTDNRISNLQLITPAANSSKAKEDGLYLAGEDNPSSKINHDIASFIRTDYESGKYVMRELAEKYGISKSRIHQIIHMHGWTALDHEDKPVSDTQRYKALGNSFAVPNALFIISRCVKQLRKEAQP